jgi:hypothetical protein
MTNSPRSPFPLLEFHCRDCGSGVGFRSRSRTFSERCLLPLFLLQPVRCKDCFRRDYRSIFTRLNDGSSDAGERVPAAIQSAASKRNVA